MTSEARRPTLPRLWWQRTSSIPSQLWQNRATTQYSHPSTSPVKVGYDRMLNPWCVRLVLHSASCMWHCLTDVQQHPEPRGPRGTFHESLDTQSSNVPRMKSAFDDMLQPERMTQGDTQTQAPPRAPRAGTRSLTTPAAKLPSDGKLTLLPGVAAGLKSEKAKLYRTATRLVAPKQKRNQPEDVVLCQCQQDGRDRDMVCAWSICQVILDAHVCLAPLHLLRHQAAFLLLWILWC